MHRFVWVRKCVAWLGLEKMRRFVRFRKCHRLVRVRKYLVLLGLEKMHRYVRVRKCHRLVRVRKYLTFLGLEKMPRLVRVRKCLAWLGLEKCPRIVKDLLYLLGLDPSPPIHFRHHFVRVLSNECWPVALQNVNPLLCLFVQL